MQSLNNIHNFLKLESFLHSINVQPSILAVTETWLKKPNQTGRHTNLCNYTFVSNSRSQSRGGVGLYINCSLNFTMRSDLTIMHEKIFESLFIEIESNNSTMIYGVIYRPPSKTLKVMHYFLSTSLIFSNQLKRNPASYSVISIIIY